MTDLSPLLAQRQTTHGSFAEVADLAQALKQIMREHRTAGLNCQQSEALDLIATKMARILCGNPNERDHWADLAGYAQLGERSCDT